MNFEQARFNMVEQQIRPWEVLDQRVLNVLHSLAREDFIVDEHRQLAYADLQIPLAHEQVMLAPVVEGRILQSLGLSEIENVLEIGTGSGYMTACLASLGKHVHSVDFFPEFIDTAHKCLSGLEVDGASIDGKFKLEQADVMSDWQPENTFDVIVMSGAIRELPTKVQNWLKPGGRLFVVIGSAPSRQAQLITRQDESTWSTENLFETDLPDLLNVTHEQPFEF